MSESITAGANGNLIITTNDSKYKTIVTDVANEKFAKYTIGGPKVNIVTAVVGDGNGAYYMPTPDMTEIKNEVWRGKIAKQEINALSKNMVDVKIILDGNVGGFTVREVGLLDEEGDLIAICNFPATPKALILEGVPSKLVILVHVLFTNVDAVQFNVDPSIDHVTLEDLEAALEKAIEAHSKEDHPDTSFIQIEHHLGCRPQVMALSYQYGAGMGEAGDTPAGGTNLIEIPTKVEYAGKDSLTIYTTKSAAKPGIDKSLHKISNTEYVITYQDNETDAVYVRLIPEQKETTFTEIARIPHRMGVYPGVFAAVVKYGAGIGGAGNGPAGGTSVKPLPVQVEYPDLNTISISSALSFNKPALRQINREEYTVTFEDNKSLSIYLRLLPNGGSTQIIGGISIPDTSLTAEDSITVQNMIFSATAPEDKSLIWGKI